LVPQPVACAPKEIARNYPFKDNIPVYLDVDQEVNGLHSGYIQRIVKALPPSRNGDSKPTGWGQDIMDLMYRTIYGFMLHLDVYQEVLGLQSRPHVVEALPPTFGGG